jgi:hypothetical protein
LEYYADVNAVLPIEKEDYFENVFLLIVACNKNLGTNH